MAERIYYKEDFDLFLKYLMENDGDITIAAKMAGFPSRNAIMAQIKQNDWLKAQVDEIQESLVDGCEAFMMRKARSKETAAAFILKYHPKARERGYGSRTELTGKNGKDLTFAQMMDESELE